MDLFSKITNLRKTYESQQGGYKLEDKREFILVRSTLTKYGLPTTNFDRNLSSLVITENKKSTSYMARTNTLNILEDGGYFAHGLFHVASNDMNKPESLEGCKIKGPKGLFGFSLNEGIADFFNKLADSQYMNKYPYEAFFAYYISRIYGMDIFREFFNGDAISFYASFKQDEIFIRTFVTCLDNYYKLSQDFLEKLKGNSKEATKVSESFINAVCEFVRLLQLKKIDESEFLSDLEALMNDKENDYINRINISFLFGSYKGKENILKVIEEETGGLGL